MKLAVVLYGQPRFWELSHESIIQETTFPDSTTDYYFHFWDRIAYHSHDSEYKLTNKDKKEILSVYKPKKASFTDYTSLKKACEEVYEIVQKHKKHLISHYDRAHSNTSRELRAHGVIAAYEKDEPKEIDINRLKNRENRYEEYFAKSIFEITQPDQLTYYLGQFVSLQEGANLIEEEYDYIFRIRTDVLFATPDLYKNKEEYTHDKQLFYERLYNNEKGIFCKYGDLQIWEGAYSNQQWNVPQKGQELAHFPITTTMYDSFIPFNGGTYASPRSATGQVKPTEQYNYKTQYLHMKDWYILGSGQEMLQCMNQYLATIIDMIKKSRIFLKRDGMDVNWAAGELVCGEVLGLNGIRAGELGHRYLDTMIISNRIMKIANKYTKQNILDRPKVRVLADSSKSLKDQYRQKILTERDV